jgi:hypothetical protein
MFQMISISNSRYPLGGNDEFLNPGSGSNRFLNPTSGSNRFPNPASNFPGSFPTDGNAIRPFQQPGFNPVNTGSGFLATGNGLLATSGDSIPFTIIERGQVQYLNWNIFIH